MTVAELIKKLQELPQDAEVLYEGGEYLGDCRHVNEVDYQKDTDWGRKGNTVVLS